jgi:fructuronate reductase
MSTRLERSILPMSTRLERSTLPPPRPPELTGPIDRPRATGIVHLGLGAFARAHPLHYIERAAELTGDREWGVLGVTGRRPAVAEALAPQDSVYGILFRSASATTLRLVGSLTGVAAAHEKERVTAAITDPATRIVTLTITEKAYAANSGPIQLLAAGLRRRHRENGAPVTVLSCDNLIGNGSRLASLLHEPAGRGPFADWLSASVRCPNSMVDRIVPATTDADRTTAERIAGRMDAGLVVAEPFGHWVIEDDFAADRPRWDLAGAVFTSDVAPFEAAKLRLLNGAHSLLAYAGSLRGHGTIAEAVADPVLLERARRLQDEARRTLDAPDGLELTEYSEEILRRFSNPALRHTTRQIAMDGSQKLPIRIVGTAADSLAAGRLPDGAAFAVASWIAYVAAATRAENDQLDDPLAETLTNVVKDSAGDPGLLVTSMLGLAGIFGGLGVDHAEFGSRVADHVRRLLSSVPGHDDGASRLRDHGMVGPRLGSADEFE